MIPSFQVSRGGTWQQQVVEEQVVILQLLLSHKSPSSRLFFISTLVATCLNDTYNIVEDA